MARTPGEIQAEIATTRATIEEELEALRAHAERYWWVPVALAFAVGLLLGQWPVREIGPRAGRAARRAGRAARTGVRVAQTGAQGAQAGARIMAALRQARR